MNDKQKLRFELVGILLGATGKVLRPKDIIHMAEGLEHYIVGGEELEAQGGWEVYSTSPGAILVRNECGLRGAVEEFSEDEWVRALKVSPISPFPWTDLERVQVNWYHALHSPTRNPQS